MKKIYFFALSCIFLIAIVSYLSIYKFWPFSTASSVPAFLGTKFEMSLPEAQRALGKKGIHLVTIREFQSFASTPKKKVLFWEQLGGIPVFKEDEKNPHKQYWYMPSVEMFSSQVVGSFNFINNHLIGVEIRIFPLDPDNSKQVIKRIENKLKNKYKFISKEYSSSVNGAYHLYFNGKKSRIDLWVNLSDKTDPIIDLNIIYPQVLSQRKSKIYNRENTAF